MVVCFQEDMKDTVLKKAEKLEGGRLGERFEYLIPMCLFLV